MTTNTPTPAHLPFRTESEMRGPVALWLNAQGFLTKAEFPLPWGICDIVGVQFQDARARERLASKQTQPVSSLELLQLLDSLPHHRAITLARLNRLLAASRSPSQVTADLQRLKAKRLVTFPRRNHIRKQVSWLPLHQRIIAIEMKLRRVAAALAQARAHLMFANESYVALPGDLADHVSATNRRLQFLDCGVGLLSVRPNRTQILLTSSNGLRPCDITPLLQTHCTERFWKMWLTNNGASTA